MTRLAIHTHTSSTCVTCKETNQIPREGSGGKQLEPTVAQVGSHMAAPTLLGLATHVRARVHQDEYRSFTTEVLAMTMTYRCSMYMAPLHSTPGELCASV